MIPMCGEPTASGMTDERERKLTDRYDAHAVAYQELWAPTLRLASIGLLRRLEGKPVKRAIDIGAGVGALWSDLRAIFPDAQLLGVDRSMGMLRIAPRDVARIVGDARTLPLTDGSVDLALLAFMLFHLNDPIDAVREARRVVRNGGIIATVTWGTDLASTATRIWTTCLDEFGAAPPDLLTMARDDLLNTPEKIETLLQAGGFATARAWANDLTTVIDQEHLLQLKTRMGSEKARFDSLSDTARQSCVASARRRLQTLSSDEFTATARIIYGIAW